MAERGFAIGWGKGQNRRLRKLPILKIQETINGRQALEKDFPVESSREGGAQRLLGQLTYIDLTGYAAIRIKKKSRPKEKMINKEGVARKGRRKVEAVSTGQLRLLGDLSENGVLRKPWSI